MQTKSSYRALKWTLFMGLAASLASACVVSTGDGDDNDFPIDGGDGGTKNTAGTKATGGTKAGTNTGGTAAGTGGTSAGTAGTGTAGTMTGEGGGDSYEPGLCFSDSPVPSSLPSCTPKDGDGNVATDCLACLKASCCDEWQTCYGSEPTSACGWGATPEANGQFDCIVACWETTNDGVTSPEVILADCDAMCLNQCSNEDFTNDDTGALVACGRESCNDQCFPAAD